MSRTGEPRNWDDELLEEFRRLSGRPSLALHRQPLHGEGPAYVDEAAVHLITNVSLHRLEQMWGHPLGGQRFRPNVVVATEGECGPFVETAWIGRRLRLGKAELEVTSACVRCRMITTDPVSLETDSSLLGLVTEEHDACFGIYASVVRTGRVMVGDRVMLID